MYRDSHESDVVLIRNKKPGIWRGESEVSLICNRDPWFLKWRGRNHVSRLIKSRKFR